MVSVRGGEDWPDAGGSVGLSLGVVERDLHEGSPVAPASPQTRPMIIYATALLGHKNGSIVNMCTNWTPAKGRIFEEGMEAAVPWLSRAIIPPWFSGPELLLLFVIF